MIALVMVTVTASNWKKAVIALVMVNVTANDWKRL